VQSQKAVRLKKTKPLSSPKTCYFAFQQADEHKDKKEEV